jgi:hypothetical protein
MAGSAVVSHESSPKRPWATRLVAQSLQEEGTMPTLASPRRLIHMTVSDYMTVADYVVIGVVALLILWGAARLFR